MPKTPPSTFPPASSATRTPRRSARSRSSPTDTCPIDSQVGIVSVGVHPAAGIQHFDAAVYNLVPPPERRRPARVQDLLLRHTRSSRCSAPAPAATTVSTRPPPRSSTEPIPLLNFQEVLWGVPATRATTSLRLNPTTNTSGEAQLPTTASSATRTEPRAPTTRARLSKAVLRRLHICADLLQQPAHPLPPEPDHLRSAAQHLSRRPLLRRRHQPRRLTPGRRPPAATSSASTRASTPSRPPPRPTPPPASTSTSASPSSQPDGPLALRAARATVTLPAGLLDQPQRRRRQDHLLRRRSALRHRRRSPVPRVLQDRQPRRSTARPSPARCPASSTSANRSPATATASSWSPTASPPTSSWPARSPPTRRPASSAITFQNLPQSPLTDFNMHFFGSERGLLATPTQCGTYPVTSTFTPWDSSLRTQTSTQFFTLDSGPERRALPGPGSAPSTPASRPPRPATPPAPTPPSRST